MNNDLISREALKEAIETYDKFACLPDGKLEPFRNLEHPEMFEPYVHLRDIRNAINNAPPIETTIENLISTLSVEELKATTWFKVDTPSGESISFRREKTGEWIPVSDRLPDEGKSVLVCYKSQGGMAQAVSERFNGDRWSALCGMKPIAWMPLPEPYKEEENE